jgi:RecB family endonuclease NucS
MEQQLEDFIIENWDNTELGEKYDLIVEDGELKSQQYKTSIGNIDILAVDKVTKDYVVIELKRNQTSDDTVGQVTRYMGWVMEYLDYPSVSGVIVVGKYDEKLYYAQKVVKNVEVFLYEVNFRLNEYKKSN